MSIELLPGLTNVVRFPLERRLAPPMESVLAIAPDCREVARVGEAFHLELPPHDLHRRADAETAAHITETVLALTPSERRAALDALDALLRPVAADAVEACRQVDRAGRRAAEAQERLLCAQAEGGSWLALLEEQADALTRHAAEPLILAHHRCQEARGVARAVGFARRGEPWVPFDLHAGTEALLEDQRHHRARLAVHGG